jgi:hypothetical protein
MKKLQKAKKIRWSIILFSHGNISKLTDCLQSLVTAVSASKTEVILIRENSGDTDVCFSLAEHFCCTEGIDFGYFGYTGQHVTNKDVSSAIEKTQGEFIVFLSEDTVVSKNFLSRLTHAYENFPIDYNLGPIGAVVPVANNAPSRQKISLPAEVFPSDVDEIQSRIEKSLTDNPSGLRWVISGIASDFCMVIPKTVIKQVGVPNQEIRDEVTRGSDYVLRLLSHNFYTIICGNVYTYRNCSEVRGVPQLPMDSPPVRYQKLGFLFKVKIDTEHLFEVFKHALKRASDVADGIFVLDEGSKIKLGLKLKEQSPELWSKITKYDKTFAVRDDKISYNKLLEWAEEEGMDWTFSLESGETIEGKVDRAYFDRLMNPVNPMVLCYSTNEFYFWDDMSTWRSDGYWGKVNSVRFSRLFPGHRIVGNDTISSQCGYVAPLPPEVIRPISLRIKCYDLCDEAHRMAAYKRVSAMRKDMNWQHIIDGSDFVGYPWRNDVDISVYTPTNIGGEDLLNWLDHVWSWTDEIVIGNDSNQLTESDKTMIEAWGGRVVPCVMGEDYGNGRNMIVKKCTKDFIFQLDSDERLFEPMIIYRMLSTDHDAWMFSIDNLQKNGDPIITETARLFRNKQEVKYWGYLHETIDDHMKKNAWKVGLSPVKLIHYGYLNMNPQKAWTKMQRYMSINLKQIQDFPEDSRAYYNLSLHLIEDNLIEDAMKLLITACYLSGGLILPVVELAKLHICRAMDLFNMVANNKQGGASSMHVKEYAKQMFDALGPMKPQHKIISFGHARAFFETNPEKRMWLFRHLKHIENTVIQPRQTGIQPENEEKKIDPDDASLQSVLNKIQESPILKKPKLTIVK